MRRRIWIAALIVLPLFGLGLAAWCVPSGSTKLTLTREGESGPFFTAVAQNGERMALTWRNSQFGLDVTEGFVIQDGLLIQDQVTFALPGGPPPPRVSPGDVADLFHTGGPFDARGMARPFSRIVYRIGEIGDPKLHLQGRTVALKQEAGFGERVTLAVSRPTLYERLRDWWPSSPSASPGG